MDPYLQLIQQLQGQIQSMNADLQNVKAGFPAGGVGPPVNVNWPLQGRMGMIKYPHKDPHPFSHVVLVKPTTTGVYFGETTSEAQGAFSVDRNAPSYLVGIDAALYQYQQAEQAENVVLNRFRPLSAEKFCSASECESLLDFEWQLFYGNDDQLAQSDWLASVLLQSDKRPAYRFPVEKEITDYEQLLIKARPLEGAGEDNRFVLKFTFWMYKMLPKRKA